MDPIERSLKLKREGRLPEAEEVLAELLGQLVDSDGRYPEPGGAGHRTAVRALASMADLLVRTGREAEAGEMADRLLAWDPSNPQALVVKGNVHINKEQYEEAARYLEAARGSISPTYLTGRLALAYYRLGDSARLRQLSAEDAGRDHTGVLKYLGLLLEREGSYTEAAALYERVVALDPGDRFSYGRLLEVKTRDRPADEVERDLSQVMKVRGTEAQLLAVRARSARRAGRFADAMGDYLEAARMEPSNAFFWAQAGFSAMRADDRECAIQCLSEALRLTPGDSVAARSLVSCYRALGRVREGMEFFENLIRDTGSNRLWGMVRILERDLPGKGTEGDVDA